MKLRRIEQIDALRGFALFGILMTHMFEGYLASLTPPQYVNFNIHYPVDGFFQFVIQNFFIGKFYSIFSLLFGLSFYLILGQKKEASSWRFAWRLVLLFMIGFLHHIHYRGDFLTVYAVFGMVLLLWKLPGPRRFLNRLVPVGRMGLSVYVTQSLIGVFIFYGYGFNLLLSLSGTMALGVGVLIFASLMRFSHWWFSRYKFGPLEWVWRSATKWQVQPNALKAPA